MSDEEDETSQGMDVDNDGSGPGDFNGLADAINRATDDFCRRVVGAQTIPNFAIDREQHHREFETCVDILRIIDMMAASLETSGSLSSIEAKCRQIVGVDGTEGLEKVRDKLVDLCKAITNYHDNFLCHTFVRACPPQPLNVGTSIVAEMIPDINSEVKPTKKMQELAAQHNVAMESISRNITITVSQLTKLFTIMNSYISFSTPEADLKPLSLHLSATPIHFNLAVTPEAKKIHTVAEYIFNIIAMRGLHRYVPDPKKSWSPEDVEVWAPIIDQNISTGVYQPLCSLPALVDQLISANPGKGMQPCDPSIAALLPGTFRGPLLNYMANITDARFPQDDPNPHLIAFTNGTFNILTCTFRPNGGSTEAMVMRAINPDDVSDGDMPFFEQEAEIHNKKVDSTASIEEHLKSSANLQPCKFVPIFFDPTMLELSLAELEESAHSFKVMLSDQDIPNDPVVEGQESKRNDVRNWIYALIGRAMIMVKERHDRWQLALFFLGCAGTGKSTIVNAIAKFFPTHTVKSLEDEGETTFALMTFVKSFTRLITGTEIPTNLPMSQIAKAISHEAISVAIKHGGAVQVDPWVAEFIFAGNVFPQNGNAAGRMSRRFVVVPMNNPIDNMQSNLEKHIEQNLPAYILLCARAYKELGSKYGADDFFTVAPHFFRAQAKGQFVQSNSLASFMNSSAFVHGPQYETPWLVIEAAAKADAGNNSAANAELRKHFRDEISIINICKSLDLTLTKQKIRKVDLATGTEYYCRWVKGIALASNLRNPEVAVN